MKFKRFNLITTPPSSRVVVQPLLSVNSKSGHIFFNEALTKKAAITLETKIEFLQDEAKPEDWFLIIDNEKGFPVSLPPNKSKGLITRTTAVAREIINSIGIKDEKVTKRFLVGDYDTKNLVWPIITASAK